MPIVTSIYNSFNRLRLKQIDFFKTHPLECQEKILFSMLKKAASTEQGRTYDYKSIDSVYKYSERVPLVTYDDIESVIARTIKGAPDILWPGKTLWFAKSSGTTNARSKFIPVTKDFLQGGHFRGIKDLLAIYSSLHPDNRLFYGKALTLGGSHTINRGKTAMTGDLSAIMLEKAPELSNFWKSPDKKTALIADFDKKMEKLTQIAVKQNITSISGVPSWCLTLIKFILDYTGKSDLSDIWPNLEVFFHGGISFSPYRNIYKNLISNPAMKYMETFNASEGFFGIQDDLNDSSMLLMLDNGTYYEFIDMNDRESSKTCTLAEVKTGTDYSMVISTEGGLWRYVIGDTIQFTNTCPYKFKITGRTKQFINVFGEEVIVDNAERALAAACKATDASVIDYTAGPVYMSQKSKGGHEWIIEFEKEPDNMTTFVGILDSTLRQINSDYDAKRFKDINLVLPVVHSVPANTFSKWMRLRNKLGGQNKVPRLANNRNYLDSILKMLNS